MRGRFFVLRVILIYFSIILGSEKSFSQGIVSSQIKKVTLFTNQALVKREATLEVRKGLNEILIGLNAFDVDKDSVSAKIYGKGSLYSVQLKKVYLKEAPQEKIKELEKKLKELRGKQESLRGEEENLVKLERFLDSFINFSQRQVSQDLKTSQINVERLEKTIEFLEKKLQELTLKSEKLKEKMREVSEEIEIVEKKLASLRGFKEKTKKVVEILFNSLYNQKIKIEVDYLVYNCGWSPFYKVNVPLNLKEVNLTMFSKIRQRSGEDWKGIKLSISNVIPLKGVTLPSLSSWFLDLQRERKLFPYQKRRNALQPFSEEKWKGESGIADFVEARKKELPLSFEYQLPQPLDIESKDKDTLLPLFSKTLKGDFFYYAIPKVSPYTFLVCKSSPDKELLSGPLNVYFGGRFIGKTYLREKKVGEDFYLNLGVDREVKVVREKSKDKVKETFFGKLPRNTIVREFGFKIKIENLKDKSIKLKVLDNIPISRTDKIIVKDIKISPQPTKENYQGKEGLLLWELEMKPREKREINIEFIVGYPKDGVVVGL